MKIYKIEAGFKGAVAYVSFLRGSEVTAQRVYNCLLRDKAHFDWHTVSMAEVDKDEFEIVPTFKGDACE